MLAFKNATALCVCTELVLLFLHSSLFAFASLLVFLQACNAFIEVIVEDGGGQLRVFECLTSFSHCMLVCSLALSSFAAAAHSAAQAELSR